MFHDFRVQLVVVGDHAVGKTCLLLAYLSKAFPTDYVPTLMDDLSLVNVKLDDEDVTLDLWDTAGADKYDRVRPLSYPGASVVLFCFSVASHVSMENAKAKWWREISHHCPEAAVLLVGTKIDLRDDREMIDKLREKGLKPVTRDEGEALAREFQGHAGMYVECSSRSLDCVDQVFDQALRSAVAVQKRMALGLKRTCALL